MERRRAPPKKKGPRPENDAELVWIIGILVILAGIMAAAEVADILVPEAHAQTTVTRHYTLPISVFTWQTTYPTALPHQGADCSAMSPAAYGGISRNIDRWVGSLTLGGSSNYHCQFFFTELDLHAPTFSLPTGGALRIQAFHGLSDARTDLPDRCVLALSNQLVTMTHAERTLYPVAFPADDAGYDRIDNAPCSDYASQTTIPLTDYHLSLLSVSSHADDVDTWFVAGARPATDSLVRTNTVCVNSLSGTCEVYRFYNPRLTLEWTTYTQSDDITTTPRQIGKFSGSADKCGTIAGNTVPDATPFLRAGQNKCAVVVSSFDYDIPRQNQLYEVQLRYSTGSGTSLPCDIQLRNDDDPTDATLYEQAYSLEGSDSSAINLEHVIAFNDSTHCQPASNHVISITDPLKISYIEGILRDVDATPYLTFAFHSSTPQGALHEVIIENIEFRVVEDVIAPDPVDDLHIVPDEDDTSISLAWTRPEDNGNQILGYQLRYTGDGARDELLTNMTMNLNYTHTGLNPEIIYSYHIGLWTLDRDGSQLLVPTLVPVLAFPSSTDIGNLPPLVNYSPLDLFPILFSEERHGRDAHLEMSWDKSITPTCSYSFGYDPRSTAPMDFSDPGQDENRLVKTFEFQGTDKSSVHIRCADPDATYIIQQEDYPVLELIKEFRDGQTYDTAGQFGTLDLVTFAVILISMVAFQSRNEVIGVVVSIFTVAIMAWLELIAFPGVMVAAVIVVIAFTITARRR